jgi:hypothetical protein
MAANKSYLGLQKRRKCHLISRITKTQLTNPYQINYHIGPECWTFSQSDEQRLDVLER